VILDRVQIVPCYDPLSLKLKLIRKLLEYDLDDYQFVWHSDRQVYVLDVAPLKCHSVADRAAILSLLIEHRVDLEVLDLDSRNFL